MKKSYKTVTTVVLVVVVVVVIVIVVVKVEATYSRPTIEADAVVVSSRRSSSSRQ